jgi:hypothetical protein
MKHFKTIAVLLLIATSFSVSARSPMKRTNNFRSYKQPTNDFVVGLSQANLTYTREWAPSVHAHYHHYFTYFFSAGLAAESVFASKNFNTVSLEVSLKFADRLVTTFKPGLAIINPGERAEMLFVTGFEAMYQLKLTDKLFWGPMAGVNVYQNDVHYIMGLHLGLGL